MANQDSKTLIPEIFTPSGIVRTTLDLMEQSVEALRTLVPGGQGTKSRNITEALDRIADGINALTDISFPAITSSQYEEVLVFSNLGQGWLTLEGEQAPYWHLEGPLYQLNGREVDGGYYDATFPFDPSTISQISQWPPAQGGPFKQPPVYGTATESGGFSKAGFTFSDGSQLVGVGPSVPKVTYLRDGSFQLWVSVAGVITFGSGRYAGARGLHTALGSSWFQQPPNIQTGEGLRGFTERVLAVFKVIRQQDLDTSR